MSTGRRLSAEERPASGALALAFLLQAQRPLELTDESARPVSTLHPLSGPARDARQSRASLGPGASICPRHKPASPPCSWAHRGTVAQATWGCWTVGLPATSFARGKEHHVGHIHDGTGNSVVPSVTPCQDTQDDNPAPKQAAGIFSTHTQALCFQAPPSVLPGNSTFCEPVVGPGTAWASEQSHEIHVRTLSCRGRDREAGRGCVPGHTASCRAETGPDRSSAVGSTSLPQKGTALPGVPRPKPLRRVLPWLQTLLLSFGQ